MSVQFRLPPPTASGRVQPPLLTQAKHSNTLSLSCCASPTPQGSPECPPSRHTPYTDPSQPRKGAMAHVTWEHKPPTSWLAMVGERRSAPSRVKTLAAGMPLGRVIVYGRRQRICPRPRHSLCGFLAVWTKPRRRWSRRFPREASSFTLEAFQASSALFISAGSYKISSTLKSFTLVCVGPVTTKSPSASK